MHNIEKIVSIYKNIKAGHDKESSWWWWINNSHRPELCVYKVDEKLKKISLRAEDDTASTAIYQNLTYVDFGGEAKAKDPVERIMEITGLSFIEAVKLFLTWEGYDINENIQYNIPKPVIYKSEEKKTFKAPYKERFLQECVLNRVRYKEQYEEIAKGLFRGCTEEEKKFAEGALYIGFMKSDDPNFSDRIFIPEYDQEEIAWGHYLYNRNAEPKGLLRKNAKRVLFGSHLLKKYSKDIIYCEGHSDTIVNIAKNYAAITSGSATKPVKDYLSLLEGKTLHDFPDLDIAGAIGAVKRRLDIIEYNLSLPKEEKPFRKISHKLYWWSNTFMSDKLGRKILEGKISQQDTLFPFLSYIKLGRFKDKVYAIIDIQLMNHIIASWLQKRNIPVREYLLPSSWQTMISKPRKMGFDFVDFHEETNEGIKKTKKENFLQKFKFKL